MQLGSKETENERFAHYLTKTYRKTASLIANSIKAVSKKKKTNKGIKILKKKKKEDYFRIGYPTTGDQLK